jgi:hypothetical protein
MKIFKLVVLQLFWLLFITNCGKPVDPELLSPNRCTGGYQVVKIFQTPGYSQDLVIQDTFCYITQGEGGLMAVNIKNALNPETASIINENVRGYSTKIEIIDSIIYIAAGSFGVTVVNVDNPMNPVVTASNLSIKPANNFYILNNYLFTTTSETGIKISEISYPSQPDIRGTINTTGYTQGVTASSDGSKLFATCGEMGLSIFDISDFQDGFGTYPLIGWCDTEGYAEAITINDSESIAFLTCGTAGLQIIDYSDMTNIHVVGKYSGGGYAKELIYKNNVIFMTAEERGLQVIDVKNIKKPTLIGSVDSEYALGIDMDENYIYIADETQGLIIISIPTK